MTERDGGTAQKSGPINSQKSAGHVPDASDVQEQDAFLDEALQESFPASDPIAPDHTSPKPPPK